MSKNGYKSNIPRINYTYGSNNTNNIKTDSARFHPQLNNLDDEADFFSPLTNQEQAGRIIHQSTEHSYDDMGNRVITTKTIRELDNDENKNKNFNQSKKSYTSKTSQASKKDKKNGKYRRISKYTNAKNELEKQRALYSSPDFQSGSPYDSPLHLNDLKNSNDFDDEDYNDNFRVDSRNIKGNNYGKYIKKERYEYINNNPNNQFYGSSRDGSPEGEIISPVGYFGNCSSGSEIEDNHMKSFDNYQSSGINDNLYNLNRMPKNPNLNYEIEDPEGFDYLRNNERNIKNNYPKNMKNTQFLNRSEFKKKIIDDSYQSDRKDFQSPDRNINEEKRFRNVTVGMIDSKGPTNNDGKVTKIMTNKVVNVNGNKVYEENVKKTKVYKNRPSKNKTNLTKVDAAKIIQAWWRRRYTGEEEVYDITVKKAIKLQSFIRGFLVRKKVLRYITLAIYYQSFCDKLQDVLCNNVKKEIFNYLKNTFLPDKVNNIRDRNAPFRPINDNNLNNMPNMPNNKNVTQREMIITQTKRTTSSQQNMPQSRIYNLFNGQNPNNIGQNKYPTSSQRSVIQSPISYPSPIPYTNQTQANFRSPTTYETRQTDVKIYHISPDIYNRNRNLNQPHKSYDNIINTKETKEITTKYTTGQRNLYNNITRYDNIENNRERNISPTFGVLNKKTTTKRQVLKTNYSNINLNDRRKKLITDTNKNIASTTTTTKRTKKIITSTKKTNKIPVKKTITTTRRNIVKNKNITKITKNANQNQIISGGTLSIVKLPNRKVNYSESEDVFTRIKEKRIEKYENYKTQKSESRFKEPNIIDNQLSINIVKIPSEKDLKIIKDKKVREEYVRFIEKPVIREKEKIVIQKEAKPETAEEGNDTQVFDMKISKRVAMSIEAAVENKEIIKDEIKEIEIFKKREREKNKQIDRYKKDIQIQKLKNKLGKLKTAIRISDYWRKRNLNSKFKQFKNNCFSVPKIYEVEVGTDVQITHKPKEKVDFSTQYIIDKVDEGSQAVLNVEEVKKVKNFDILKITKNRSISFEQKIKKKEKQENRITKSKLNIISKIPKIEFGQQSEPWHTQISKVKSDINILYSKPETVEGFSQYPHIENQIDEINQIQIVQDRPELVDMEVQHEPEDNYIDDQKVEIEIKGKKLEAVESVTQYDKPESRIINGAPFSIFGEPKEEVIVKVETADAECNTFNETVEQGVNAVVEEEPKPKNIEVQIRTVKRSLVKMEIPLLKKIWKRKAFRTFKENCQRPEYHKVIGREILRMALLRWRFVKGYGPDRYGNAYDRDGNILYKTKPKVADLEVQQDFIVETEDQSTQYIPIENIISTLKQFEIGASYRKRIEPEKVDQAVGNDIKMGEIIQRGETVSYKYKKKEKPENRVAKNQRLEIKNVKKDLRDQGTEMAVVQNTISKLEKLNISGTEYKLRNENNSRRKELLIQMIYRKMMGDKLALSDALRKWLKKTILILQIEQFDLDKQKRRYASISKNERFAFIEEIKKMEMGTQIEKTENKVEKMDNINVIRVKNTKDCEVNVNIPNKFDIEEIKPKNEEIITFKSKKKPIVLETKKENEMNILSKEYIFKEEVEKGIHHPMTEEAKTKVSEILIKYFQTHGGPHSVLKKYFTTWRRKANYLNCLDNARIITRFCRKNINKTIVQRKWKKITEKLILKEKVKIIKLSRFEDFKRNKIFDLIRLTRINSVLAKRRYIHYILLCWLAYKRNMNRKRKQVKALYENMLNTYMHMADDVFGNNQKENPSVQDALFEAVESDKFQTKNLNDVPLAKKYYEEKKEIKKVTTNITIVNNTNPINEPKEIVTYKAYISSNQPLPLPSPLTTSPSTGNIKGKIIKEKIITVLPGERLQSRGRGRKYRTKNEREILNKFYQEKKIYTKKNRYDNKEEEKEDDEIDLQRKYMNNLDANNKDISEGNFNGNFGEKYGGSKSISIQISTNKTNNNLGGSYNYSLNMNDNDLNNSKNKNLKEISYRKRRALFGKYKKEEEKELEDEK